MECRFLQELAAADITVAAIDHAGDENPVDMIWGSKRPAPPQAPVRIHKMAYAGEAVQDKLAKVNVRGDAKALAFGRELVVASLLPTDSRFACEPSRRGGYDITRCMPVQRVTTTVSNFLCSFYRASHTFVSFCRADSWKHAGCGGGRIRERFIG